MNNTRLNKIVESLDKRTVHFDAQKSVTIGDIVQVKMHPSGSMFDGDAVVISAYTVASGARIVNVIALNDVMCRTVSVVIS